MQYQRHSWQWWMQRRAFAARRWGLAMDRLIVTGHGNRSARWWAERWNDYVELCERRARAL
jgi:hypothetical protein